MIEPSVIDIKEATKENGFFREVLFTATNDSSEPFEKGTMFCVPAGARHNVINIGGAPLKLFSLYAPPQQAS